MANIIELALMMLLAFLIGCLISWFIRCVLMGKSSAFAGTKTTVSANKSPAGIKASAGSTATPKSASVAKKSSKPAAAKAKPAAAKAKPAAAKAKPAAAKAKPKKAATDGRPKALKSARDGRKDDLKRIKGVGPKIETTLNGLGIFHFDQIAEWNRTTINWVDDHLSFHGRIDREKWVSQAKTLAKGGATEFSRRVDKGTVPTSK